MAFTVQPKKGNKITALIDNAYLLYPKFQKPDIDDKYGQKPSYNTKVLIDAQTAKKYVEYTELSKDDANKRISKYSAEEFKAKFKIDPPYKAKQYLVMTLKCNACTQSDIPSLKSPDGSVISLKAGDPWPYFTQARLKVVMDKDGAPNSDITLSENIGNGTKAIVAVTIQRHKTFGIFTPLSMIKVVDLVSYESIDDSPFGPISNMGDGTITAPQVTGSDGDDDDDDYGFGDDDEGGDDKSDDEPAGFDTDDDSDDDDDDNGLPW